jgi:hypothetical protein
MDRPAAPASKPDSAANDRRAKPCSSFGDTSHHSEACRPADCQGDPPPRRCEGRQPVEPDSHGPRTQVARRHLQRRPGRAAATVDSDTFCRPQSSSKHNPAPADILPPATQPKSWTSDERRQPERPDRPTYRRQIPRPVGDPPSRSTQSRGGAIGDPDCETNSDQSPYSIGVRRRSLPVNRRCVLKGN